MVDMRFFIRTSWTTLLSVVINERDNLFTLSVLEGSRTPLSIAASGESQYIDLDIIEILLESGADPNSKAGARERYGYANHSLLISSLYHG